jgi:protein-S-isoprenylcysteine O-methyltransferase Ste14
MRPDLFFLGLWAAWGLSWIAASFWSAPTEKRAAGGGNLYRLMMLIGGIIFFIPAHGYDGPLRFWLISWTGAWICVGLTALGIAFTWWARLYLGPLWSGSVTKKEGHRIVDTGPYGIVRHPIYTGILLAIFATMLAKGTLLGIVGAAIIMLGVWLKARLEERFLAEELGADAYDAYRRRVPMLVPFGPK